EIVHGMDALAHEAVWARLFALTSPRAGVIEGKDGLPPPVPRSERSVVMGAIAGIDIALWDLKGKAAGLPVWRLLGGENRPLVTYATGGYYRPGGANSAYTEEMSKLIGLGYRAVKLKTGLGGVAADPRASRAGAAALRLRRGVAWRGGERPACPRAVSGTSRTARRAFAFRRAAGLWARTGLEICRALSGPVTCSISFFRAAASSP